MTQPTGSPLPPLPIDQSCLNQQRGVLQHFLIRFAFDIYSERHLSGRLRFEFQQNGPDQFEVAFHFCGRVW